MPNIGFPLQRSFVWSVPVNRPGHPNDTLFFYAYEKSKGSLTNAKDQTSPSVNDLLLCSNFIVLTNNEDGLSG